MIKWWMFLHLFWKFINISINKEVKKIWRLFGDREGFSKIRKRVNGGDRRANTRKKRLRRINTISHPNDDEEWAKND